MSYLQEFKEVLTIDTLNNTATALLHYIGVIGTNLRSINTLTCEVFLMIWALTKQNCIASVSAAYTFQAYVCPVTGCNSVKRKFSAHNCSIL